MNDFKLINLTGVILDLTNSINEKGVTNINFLKDIFIKRVLESDDIFYIADQEQKQTPKDQGECTYFIATYKENLKFFVDTAFKNAVYAIGEYAEDCNKSIFLITDRFKSSRNFQYRKGFLMNSIHNFNTKIYVFGIGNDYDKDNLKFLVEDFDFSFDHLEDLSLLPEKMFKILGN
jgi:hypothetical protein